MGPFIEAAASEADGVHMLFENDREYYAARHRYSIEKAETTEDSSVKATHLVMAAEYQRRAQGGDRVASEADMTAADAGAASTGK